MLLNVCFALSLLGGIRVAGYLTEPLLRADDIHKVTGEAHRVASPPPDVHPLTVVTWNIERGSAFDRILSELRRLKPDIVLLQEVDRDCRRSGRRDVARDLATTLNMNWVSAGEFQEIGEGSPDRPALTGQAILSRFPIEDAAALPFESQARWRWTLNPVQPRRGGRMTLRAQTGGLLIYNTHFESGHDENLRGRQSDEITRDASRHPAASTLVAGDLNNASIVVSPIFRNLADASFKDLLDNVESRGPTSYGQTHPIDWMFGRNVASGGGHVVSVSEPASDHFPVVASVRMPAPAGVATAATAAAGGAGLVGALSVAN